LASRPAPVARPSESGWIVLGGIALTYVAVALVIFGLYSMILGLASLIF
jgi:hypothetical protein